MKASKYSEAQKAFILKQGSDGVAVADICRKAGITAATYFNWKKLRISQRCGRSAPVIETRFSPIIDPRFSYRAEDVRRNSAQSSGFSWITDGGRSTAKKSLQFRGGLCNYSAANS